MARARHAHPRRTKLNRDRSAVREGVFSQRRQSRPRAGRCCRAVGSGLVRKGGNEGVAFVLDLSERKRAEEALRESERNTRLIVDSIPGLVGILNSNGEIEAVNRQILEYYGKTLEELKE